MATRAQIQELVDRLVEGYQPENAILFGSHAYGTPREDSDVDLFVSKDDTRPRPEQGIAAGLAIGRRKIGVDVLVYTQNEFADENPRYNGLIKDVLERGILMYAR